MSDLAPKLLALCRKYNLALLCTLRLAAKRGAVAAPIIRLSRIFHIRRASPISGVRIAAPIVLAQHEGHKRIGEANCTQWLKTRLGYLYIMCGTIHEFPNVHLIGRECTSYVQYTPADQSAPPESPVLISLSSFFILKGTVSRDF
jgi:hypothetical protein